MNKKIFKIAIYSLLTLVVAYIAFYNGYPLVTSDSGAYINNGFHISPPPLDRPLTYSFFLRISSLEASLWLSVIAQSALLIFLLFRTTRLFFASADFTWKVFALVILGTSAFTSISWYASQLMPDIFTAVMILSALLYLKDDLKKGKYLYPALIFLSALMHNSNLLTLFIFSVLFFLYAWRFRRIYFQKSIGILAISFVSLISTCTINESLGNGFTLSPSTHVFLMGKFCENGVLKTFLKDRCPAAGYELCNYKDQLPDAGWDFVWNGDSPLYKMGGWQKTRTEYNRIIADILKSPYYWPMLIYKSTEHSIRQMFHYEVGDGLFVYKENSNPFWKVQESYPHELPEYMRSRQNSSTLELDFYNHLYWLFLIISTGIVTGLIHYRHLPADFIFAYMLILLFYVINAFVTANFANVLARLSSRIIWLIPFLNILFIFKMLLIKRNTTL